MPNRWNLSYRADPVAAKIADRHYSRKKIGTPQFVPPGRCVVLISQTFDAYWVTSFPYAEYVKHAWPGAWICSAFRNESKIRSSELILEAVAITRYIFGAPPDLGMLTFVNIEKTLPKAIWNKSQYPWGRCFQKAGFVPANPYPWTKDGLFALQLLPQDCPEALCPSGMQLSLFVQSGGRTDADG